LTSVLLPRKKEIHFINSIEPQLQSNSTMSNKHESAVNLARRWSAQNANDLLEVSSGMRRGYILLREYQSSFAPDEHSLPSFLFFYSVRSTSSIPGEPLRCVSARSGPICAKQRTHLCRTSCSPRSFSNSSFTSYSVAYRERRRHAAHGVPQPQAQHGTHDAPRQRC